MIYCPIPWIHQAIRNNGDMRVCCIANQGEDKGLLRKDDGTIYNAAFDDLNEARNCKKLRDIRLAMINDKWHPDCIRCEREYKSRIRTRFIYEQEAWSYILRSNVAEKLTNSDGTIDTDEIPIVYYDIRFGNLCNLKCRTCGPTDSSSWYKDYYKLWGDTYHESIGEMKIIRQDGRYFPENNIYFWYNNDNFWKQLYNNINNIKHIQVVGGEPLLISKLFELLDELVKQDKAKEIKIEYNTNITTITEKTLDLWKHFRGIRIGASVDGVGIINDYIRYPSKFEDIERNLRLLDNAEGNFEIWLAVTVQVLNLLHLPDMMKWKRKQNYKRINCTISKPFVTSHPLHSPHFLNIKVLPAEAKKKVIEKFNKVEFNEFPQQGKKILDEYIAFMMQEDYSHHLHNFWKQTEYFDRTRNQRLEDYIPELYELIKETKK